MPLALRPNPASAPARRKTDHLVMNGQLEVGRIYKRDTPDKSDTQWLWAINGVPRAAPGVMRVAGIAASFEHAKAELQENWEKWLAWANLQEIGLEEIGGTVPLEPASTPLASEDIGGSVPLQPASTPVAPEDISGLVPLQPEPAPAPSDLAQCELDIAGEARLSETSPEPARSQSADAGRRGSPRRKKWK
jgi:hypothetical protein